jgi:predicted transposase YbfD/YdcC
MVSAFAARQRLVLGQVKVADKSNEIIAIPALLDMLTIEGAVITIDAMGCQRDIAQKVIDKKADYILALKGNQGTLREDVGGHCSSAQHSHSAGLAHRPHQRRGGNECHASINERNLWSVQLCDACLSHRASAFRQIEPPTSPQACCKVRLGDITGQYYEAGPIPHLDISSTGRDPISFLQKRLYQRLANPF